MHTSLMLKEMNVGLCAVARAQRAGAICVCFHTHTHTKEGRDFCLLFATVFSHHMVSLLLGAV